VLCRLSAADTLDLLAAGPSARPEREALVELFSYKDVEVRPEAVTLFVAAFDMFPSIGQKYLVKHGIVPSRKSPSSPPGGVTPPGGTNIGAAVNPGSGPFIRLSSWLAALQEILADIGPNALFKLGEHIVDNPYLPPDLSDVEMRLRELDVAFHMSHRRGGKPMYNQITKNTLAGIGNFLVERPGREKLVYVRCDTPYPCPLEHGIVSGVVTQLEPRASIQHYDPGTCRMKASSRCTYIVKW
jgi:hypothetical protein